MQGQVWGEMCGWNLASAREIRNQRVGWSQLQEAHLLH